MKILLATGALLLSTTAVVSVPLSPATALPKARDSHGSVIVGRNLYVLGGAETTAWKPTASVLRAPILSNNLLGDWQEVEPLPRKTLYIGSSVVTQGDMIYVVGGQERQDDRSGDEGTKVHLDSVTYSRVNSDGSLGGWVTGPSWGNGHGLSCGAAVNRRALYVSGGSANTGSIGSQVFFSPLDAEGNPGRWQETAPLPQGLWFHQMAISGETIYVLAGRSGNSATGMNTTVLRSRIQGDDSLAAWEALPEPNPSATFQGAYTASSHHVFSIGGKDRNWFVQDKISFGRLTPHGISNWQSISVPDSTLEKLGVAASGELGLLYLTGGRSKPDYSSISDAVTFVALKKASEFRRPLPPGFDCLASYEEALTTIRERNGRMLLITVSPNSDRSVEAARALCIARRAYPPDITKAFLNITEDAPSARKLGLIQPGITAMIDRNERVLSRSSEPFGALSIE